jgi:maltodextrin utilization protein YvdJ
MPFRANSFKEGAMWHIDPLLSGDSVSEMVSGQWLSKHVPMAAIKLLLEMGCLYMVHAEML